MPTVKELRAQLAAAEKAEKEAAESGGRSTRLDIKLDLGDAAQVALARAQGWLKGDDTPVDDESEGDGEPDETPTRPGYFGN